jgi:hypothetical protein
MKCSLILLRSLFLLLAITTSISGCEQPQESKDALFTMDNLMSYNYYELVKLAGNGLKDSIVTDKEGHLVRYSIFTPKTKPELIEIRWEDITRQRIQYVTIRGSSAGTTRWKTPDSSGTGALINDLRKRNTDFFVFSKDGSKSLQFPMEKTDDCEFVFNEGEGMLRNHVHSLRLDEVEMIEQENVTVADEVYEGGFQVSNPRWSTEGILALR